MERRRKPKTSCFRDTIELLVEQLACAQRRLKAANIRMPYSPAERLHILWCVEYFGIPRRQIPKHFGVARSTVWRWLWRLQDGIGLCGRKCEASVRRTSEELERLVWEMASANAGWGRRHIALVLGTLGIFLAASTVRNIFYMFLVFDHARREVRHFAVTAHPSMEWVIQQLREAMPFGEQPRYLLPDNDGIYGLGVRAFLISCGILDVRTAYRSPWQNPYVERVIGTLRRELLDHVIVLNQAHLERLLKEFVEDYYHTARPHQGLGGETPVPQSGASTGQGELISVPVLGGLHRRYYRAAA